MVLKYRVLILLFLFIVVTCNNSFSQDDGFCDISIDKKIIIDENLFIEKYNMS